MSIICTGVTTPKVQPPRKLSGKNDWVGKNSHLESKVPDVIFSGSFTEGVRGN
jgi:hypothetical protein